MTVYPAERSSFLEYPSQPFKKETPSCYINRALDMTSSTADTLRIKFNSMRGSFFKKRLHLSAKREGSGWRRQRRGRVVCFSQNKADTKILINDVNQGISYFLSCLSLF